MLRETVEAAREDAQLDEITSLGEDPAVVRRLLHAVETYKAACAAADEKPTVEDGWLVLISALQLEDRK